MNDSAGVPSQPNVGMPADPRSSADDFAKTKPTREMRVTSIASSRLDTFEWKQKLGGKRVLVHVEARARRCEECKLRAPL
jgi:hypothetical protein